MSTNNVKRFSAPDANNRITEWVTTYANHYDEILTALTRAQLECDALNERLANYDALAASHAELVGLIAALLPAAESALHEANRGCGAPAWGDAIAQARLALTRAKALV